MHNGAETDAFLNFDYVCNLWTLLNDLFFYCPVVCIHMYGSDYWSTEGQNGCRWHISREQPLSPWLDRLSNSCPLNWFATFLRNPFSSASSFVSIAAAPTVQRLGVFQYTHANSTTPETALLS